MARISVVENPQKKRRKNRSTKSKRKNGNKRKIGGFKAMSKRKTKKRSTRRRTTRRTTRRRRNPTLAAISNPRRSRRKSYRRRRNPGLGRLGQMFDVTSILSIGGGVIINRSAVGLISKVWAGVPSLGAGAIAVRLGANVVAAMVAKKVFKSQAIAKNIVSGGIAIELYEFLKPHLSGMGVPLEGYYSNGMTSDRFRESAGLTGYEYVSPKITRLSGTPRMVDPTLAA